MHRESRLQCQVTVQGVDGSVTTLRPGPCKIDEDGNRVRLTWHTPEGTNSVTISGEEFAVHLARRDLVYVSW